MNEIIRTIASWLASIFRPAPAETVATSEPDQPVSALTPPFNRSRAITMLSNEEGRKNRPYRDSEGYLTIGVGHLMDPRKGGFLPEWAQFELDSAGFLSERSIDRLLEDDLQIAMGHLERHLPWALTLDSVRYGVLLDCAG